MARWPPCPRSGRRSGGSRSAGRRGPRSSPRRPSGHRPRAGRPSAPSGPAGAPSRPPVSAPRAPRHRREHGPTAAAPRPRGRRTPPAADDANHAGRRAPSPPGCPRRGRPPARQAPPRWWSHSPAPPGRTGPRTRPQRHRPRRAGPARRRPGRPPGGTARSWHKPYGGHRDALLRSGLSQRVPRRPRRRPPWACGPGSLPVAGVVRRSAHRSLGRGAARAHGSGARGLDDAGAVRRAGPAAPRRRHHLTALLAGFAAVPHPPRAGAAVRRAAGRRGRWHRADPHRPHRPRSDRPHHARQLAAVEGGRSPRLPALGGWHRGVQCLRHGCRHRRDHRRPDRPLQVLSHRLAAGRRCVLLRAAHRAGTAARVRAQLPPSCLSAPGRHADRRRRARLRRRHDDDELLRRRGEPRWTLAAGLGRRGHRAAQ